MNPLVYLDAVLVALGLPLVVLMGLPTIGYAIGGGAWLALRAIGLGMERAAVSLDTRTELSLRMGYMLGRLFLLALAVVLARRAGTRDDGLAALIVIVLAFTAQLATSFLTRPRRT